MRQILVSGMHGELIKKNVPFTGFGGVTSGNLYQVTIEVGDLIYLNMHIIANSELDTSYNLILSATMFHSLIYEIDDRNHKLNVTVPDNESYIRNLKIEDRNGRLYVLCNSMPDIK